MFKRRREKKALKEAEKKRKAEEKAAAESNIQLIRVAPRGTQYGGESPDFPLALRNPQMSQSMDALNHHDQRSPFTSVHAVEPIPLSSSKFSKKKRGLRRVQSLADDAMLGQLPYQRNMPVYYETVAPMYVIDEHGNGDLQVSRPRYVVSALPPQHGSGYVATAGTPVLYQPHHYQHRQAHAMTPTPTSSVLPPEMTQQGTPRGKHRNYAKLQIIPKSDGPSSNRAGAQQRRPVSHVFPGSAQVRPNSTPLRTPSPIRSPSPAVYSNTGQRKGKGKAIRVVEGWDEPEDERPKFIQSHEVGVAPKSKVVENYNTSHLGSSPFSITISNDDPSGSSVQRRDPSRRNKARPVSAAPWVPDSNSRQYQDGEPITQNGHVTVDNVHMTVDNGHMTVDFTE